MSSKTHEIAHDVAEHPVHGTAIYWWIGLYLTLVTGGEIACFYFEHVIGPWVTPLILALSAVKFALVVMFYMHLKYDSRVFSGIFIFGAALGTLAITGVTILYHVLDVLR
ncbi:MAG TPA: cytochrome C oxidase subunit IV family protein [Longimicrobiaceae bacterium]|jgi:cytochrome c oxidase subunit 4|nr:cytochrome C oxidase subunit IV family protein [Longimicrobiaceae bacterium]